jgi:PhoPQ-activated pathogenicity-related protein
VHIKFVSIHSRVFAVASALIGVVTLSFHAEATPLDDYVAAPDASFTWSLATTIPGAGYTDYVLDLKSQTWDPDPPSGVDRILWEHALIITVPDTVSHTTGMLFIDGGSNPANLTAGSNAFLIGMAIRSESVVARLRQVPNQPLTFANDPLSMARVEDEQIAYAWRQFLDLDANDADAIWLSRLPMTKAAVRAMDAVTAFCGSPAGGSLTVNQFVVAGGSKRGWTTWTTAAVDARVVAIAPLVIDLLNTERSFQHHFEALGKYADSVHDYVDNGIIEFQGTPEYARLLEIVEPFSYRDRLTMPKYIVNSTQDQFFLPDSSQFYQHRLHGETRFRYVQNNDHSLSRTADAAEDIEGWYTMFLNGVARPEISWVKRDDGQLQIQVVSGTPMDVNVWEASNAAERNFIWDEVGSTGIYSETSVSTLSQPTPGTFVTNVPLPGSGYKAFFVEFEFPSGGTFPFRCTTEVSVIPDVLPYGPQYDLGTANDVLDAAFYAGEAVDGSDVAGRWGFFGRANNAGTKIAFWAVNADTFLPAIFLVDIGDPLSWRRITADLAATPNAPIYWTPDDSALFVGDSRIDIPIVGQLAALVNTSLHGYGLDDTSMTAMAADNWAVARGAGEVVALPILPNGQEDTSRNPVIVTNLAGAGIEPDWPSVAPDGTAITFADFDGIGALGVGPDLGDVYSINNLQDILAAAKIPGTDISTLAPTTVDDENVIHIRTAESNNFAHSPAFSQDKSLVFFNEDWNNVFADDDFFATFVLGDFDVMAGYADGFEADIRLAEAGNQGAIAPTRGGTRIVYISDVAAVPHLFISTLEVARRIAGTQLGGNNVVTLAPQTASDASGTKLHIPTGTTVDFPTGVEQAINITTPIDPVQTPELPAGAAGIPVVRDFGPDGTTFSPPIEVTVSYTDAEIVGLIETDLKIYRYNPGTGVFDQEITSITNHDLEANTITFTLSSFSTYGLGGNGIDTDGDGIPDLLDPDDDNDGIPDDMDPFPLDTDNDGLDNDVDPDDDNDGVPDDIEELFGTDPLDASDTPSVPASGRTAWLLAIASIAAAGAFTLRRRWMPERGHSG